MYASFSSNNYDLIFLSFVGGLSLPRQDNFLCLIIEFVCSALAAIYSPAAGKIALKQVAQWSKPFVLKCSYILLQYISMSYKTLEFKMAT